MNREHGISRRKFINLAAVTGTGIIALDSVAASNKTDAQNNLKTIACNDKYQALPQIRLLADLFVKWQMNVGRLDPGRTACANWGHKRNSYPRLVIGLNQAFRITGEEAYRQAADRMAVFYLGCLCNTADFHPPHFGLGMVMYREIKKNHPQVLDFDEKAAALFEWMKPFVWDKGSYYRNGYPGGTMPDAGNSCDNADVGNGLMALLAIKKRPEVLVAAEVLGRYFLEDVEPGTYQGVWSSRLGTWVVAPTTQDKFEHFSDVSSREIAWGYTSIIAISYLVRLSKFTENKEMQTGIAEKCVSSMKWQFDACQFSDGACGMSGRDDKWLGMTAGAVLSYLRVRDAGYLCENAISQYRPKAQAARDWLLANITSENLNSKSAGYFPVTSRSHPRPPDNVAWNLGYTLEVLPRVQDI